jgi:hypothetical protein
LVLFFTGDFIAHKIRVKVRKYSDFDCYYTAGKRFLNREDIYVSRDQQTSEFRYTPLFAAIMAGFALVSEEKADILWFILNYLLLVISLVLTKKIVAPCKTEPRSLYLLYGLSTILSIRFILHTLDSGQVNILMMFSILAGLYCASQNKDIVAGALLGFSAMTKLTPVIFIPYFLLKKRIRLATMIAVSILIYFLFPALIIGWKNNFHYMRDFFPFLFQSTITEKSTLLDPQNQSLMSLILRTFTDPSTYYPNPLPMPYKFIPLKNINIKFLFLLLSGLIYLSVLLPARKSLSQRNMEGRNFCANIDYALLLICLVVFNLNAWRHNYIFLIFPYFLLIFYLIQVRFKDKYAIGGILLAYLLSAITWRPFVSKELSSSLLLYSPYTLGALLIFVMLVKIKFQVDSCKVKGNTI